jgi:hypothetical protein
MKIQAFLLAATLFCAPFHAADPTRLSPRFRTVYILEMSNGLDQYLANRLTANRAAWVVLEPHSADAVLTESVDDGFWTWLTKAYPSTAPAPAPQEGDRGPAVRRDPGVSAKRPGMVFLVDPRRRVVLWSASEMPRTSSPNEMQNAADRIALQLKSAFEKK